MIRREYKTVKLFLVLAIAITATWRGKKNLAWLVSQASDRQCAANLLLVECR